MTHFRELVPADSAGSEVVVAAILDWFKRFGLPESWESDNGSHFKAEVMAQLSERLKANQSFVPVYTPWREKKRLYEMARAKGSTCNFAVGGFVLWSRVDSRRQGSKLLVHWVGPFRVVEARQHSFIVEHLITKDEVEEHGSRLKFYCDSSLNVTAALKEHVAKQGIVVGVRAVINHRKNPVSNKWEVQVAWIVLEDVENSWEPLRSVYTDIPTKVQEYVDSNMIIDLDWLQATPVPED
ncbi:hypothetical protein PHMEG_00017166 [Phytophthora megakarya]|uniref:Integrase catalytic domain-containing protein n=1 Tax=Phytophthora megakarya TaxID=4795 RepID=A0A225VXF9_9STRA|nr:hypothetical protein PHMEG_00017166 [Phytophthora megakarya]